MSRISFWDSVEGTKPWIRELKADSKKDCSVCEGERKNVTPQKFKFEGELLCKECASSLGFRFESAKRKRVRKGTLIQYLEPRHRSDGLTIEELKVKYGN